MKEYIEGGKIINTHGVSGELKLEVWLDSVAYLKKFRRIFVSGNADDLTEYKVISVRDQKGFALAKLDGVTDINSAMILKGRTFFVRREDAKLKPGEYFLCDIIGASVVDEVRGEIGTLKEIIESPAQPIYVVRGETEHLIPAVPEFVTGADFSEDIPVVRVRLIEGM